MTALTPELPLHTTYEFTEIELRTVIESLDRQELESLIAAIYAQAGGVN